MRVTSIAENTSSKGLPVEHGLSLFIEKNDGQKVLFDMGQSSMFAQNAKTLGLSGQEQFCRLKSFMGAQIEYLACGDDVTI